eukprot:8315564-Pyramimonas_sp.AAC.1
MMPRDLGFGLGFGQAERAHLCSLQDGLGNSPACAPPACPTPLISVRRGSGGGQQGKYRSSVDAECSLRTGPKVKNTRSIVK